MQRREARLLKGEIKDDLGRYQCPVLTGYATNLAFHSWSCLLSCIFFKRSTKPPGNLRNALRELWH